MCSAQILVIGEVKLNAGLGDEHEAFPSSDRFFFKRARFHLNMSPRSADRTPLHCEFWYDVQCEAEAGRATKLLKHVVKDTVSFIFSPKVYGVCHRLLTYSPMQAACPETTTMQQLTYIVHVR